MHRITLSETPKNFPCGRDLLFSTKMRGVSSIVPGLRCMDKMARTLHPQGFLGLLLLLHREGSLYPNARLQTLLMQLDRLMKRKWCVLYIRSQGTILSLHSTAARSASYFQTTSGRWHSHSKLQVQPSTQHEKYSVHSNRAKQSLFVETWSTV